MAFGEEPLVLEDLEKDLLSYKRKWGGDEIPYFHFIKIVNKKSYKLFRLASKPDWIFRNYKKKHYKKTKNVK